MRTVAGSDSLDGAFKERNELGLREREDNITPPVVVATSSFDFNKGGGGADQGKDKTRAVKQQFNWGVGHEQTMKMFEEGANEMGRRSARERANLIPAVGSGSRASSRLLST